MRSIAYYIVEGEPDVEVMTARKWSGRAGPRCRSPDYPALTELWERDWTAMARRVVVAGPRSGGPVDIPAPGGGASARRTQARAARSGHTPQSNNGNRNKNVTQSPQPAQPPPEAKNTPKALETLTGNSCRRESISEASMLDYLKEEGRIADFVTRIADVPEAVIEDVVSSWVGMMEEE